MHGSHIHWCYNILVVLGGHIDGKIHNKITHDSHIGVKIF
jgi:hypothetical protein